MYTWCLICKAEEGHHQLKAELLGSRRRSLGCRNPIERAAADSQLQPCHHSLAFIHLILHRDCPPSSTLLCRLPPRLLHLAYPTAYSCTLLLLYSIYSALLFKLRIDKSSRLGAPLLRPLRLSNQFPSHSSTTSTTARSHIFDPLAERTRPTPHKSPCP
jgi:hypothetical protein